MLLRHKETEVTSIYSSDQEFIMHPNSKSSQVVDLLLHFDIAGKGHVLREQIGFAVCA